MIEGFSAPFQKALQLTLMQKAEESPPTNPSPRNYSTRKSPEVGEYYFQTYFSKSQNKQIIFSQFTCKKKVKQ
jgi:hypothetical protein